MGTRKCCVNGCTSQESQEKDAGVTFHRFPQNALQIEKWLKVCKLETNFKPTKNTYVCSRHFKRENFTSKATGKIVLKSLTVPSIFPWNKTAVTTPSTSKPPSPPQSIKSEPLPQPCIKSEGPEDSNVVVKLESPMQVKQEEESSPLDGSKKKKPPTTPKPASKSPEKPKKSSKRLSAKMASSIKIKAVVPPATPERIKAVTSIGTPKKKNQVVIFVPGTLIEAQNFDQRWMPVKVIEVDMDDREVLVRSCDKNSKSKTGINDEWISMDSPRLRPAQPIMTFEVGEKVLARWNDCRKFPAMIKRVLDNDTYDVLFDDGYPKIVRGIHINKYSTKNLPKVQSPESPMQPIVINPLLLNPPSLIPDYIKEMKDAPVAPTEGEWCCAWVDDIPVGQESAFDGPHGKLPSIIVPDWRLKEGWQKHIYLRQNGKWDVLFISPTNRKLRFKNELKVYLAEIGETYDPETWDFSLQKKRSKMLGLSVVSDNFKNRGLAQNFDVNSDPNEAYNNPFATLGALPYVQPNLVFPPPTQTEIRVGSLKVRVVDNIYQCPQETCDKTFRKENHLQLHIKHYHDDLAKLMGECLNMEDLAYLRTTVDEVEVTPTKPTRKPHVPKPRAKNELNDSFREIYIKTENSTPEMKFQTQRSPILEEALKAPLITSMMSANVKTERDCDIKTESTMSSSYSSMSLFDPEALIPPHAVSKPGHARFGPGRKRLRARFNPKPKRAGTKKRRLDLYEDYEEAAASNVQGIIPYHEGPYFKHQQSNFVDENGEVIKIVRMKKEEIINCICGYGEEDGLMIQCELCLCWQHGLCNGIDKPGQVPENYVCIICKNPYRQRPSQKYNHDQEWLYDGKLPVAGYHMPNPKQTARFDTLKQCHTLIGNLKEMKRFMNSLDVKINIAEKRGHPKLYLWAKKWEQSPPPAATDTDSKDDVKLEGGGDIRMLPIIPEPELAIEPEKCQQTLMDHIQYQQKSVKSRLDTIDAEITALEEASASKCNGKMLVDEPKMKQTFFMLLNDLMKMNQVSAIHRN